jgi:hypothetical protein
MAFARYRTNSDESKLSWRTLLLKKWSMLDQFVYEMTVTFSPPDDGAPAAMCWQRNRFVKLEKQRSCQWP